MNRMHDDTTTIAPPARSAALPSLSSAPVGVFDSGVGGLSVVRAIRRELPAESLIYCADSHYAPYGERSEAFITDRSLAIGQWLVSQGCKAIVVACNTATTIAIAALRTTLSVPIIGVEPGVKPAVAASRAGVVAVLATAGTLRSASFQRLVASHAGDCRLICTPGLGLVEAIEQGDTDSPALAALLERYLRPMIDAGADTLALGCTHYPFLIPLIQDITQGRLTIVDNSTPVARQLARQLALQRGAVHEAAREVATEAHGAAANDASDHSAVPPSLRFVATGTPELLGAMAYKALGVAYDAQLQHIPSALAPTVPFPVAASA